MSDNIGSPARYIDTAPSVGHSGPLFIFDVTNHELKGADGHSIKLRPQSLAVFELLFRHANEVVSKEDILNDVWKGIAVTDDSVTQCIVDIRRALGKEHRALLQTVPRVGYRLCLGSLGPGCPVIGVHEAQESTTDNPSMMKPAVASDRTKGSFDVKVSDTVRRNWMWIICGASLIALVLSVVFIKSPQQLQSAQSSFSKRGPTLAVLPFHSVGTVGDSSYFGEGITEDIITSLSRFSELGIVSWSTIANRATSDNRIKAIASEFGVRYLISGSVRHEAGRVRVAVRLTDARNAHLLWSESYDEPVQDVFVIQDRIASEIVSALAVKLTQFETEHVRSIPTSNIEAYQLSLLGRHELRKRTREANRIARARFAEAIQLDPGYADAYIRLGETYLEEALYGWTEWPAQATEKALLLARKAIDLGGVNARSLGFLARLHVRTGENKKAQEYLDRALVFNANDPALHEIQGVLHLWNGFSEKAIPHLEYVLRYDPDSIPTSSHLSVAYYVAGKLSDAVSSVERLIERAPNILFSHVILTAALVELGELESAKAAAAVVRQRHPFVTADGMGKVEFFSTMKSDDVSSLHSGLPGWSNESVAVRLLTTLPQFVVLCFESVQVDLCALEHGAPKPNKCACCNSFTQFGFARPCFNCIIAMRVHTVGTGYLCCDTQSNKLPSLLINCCSFALVGTIALKHFIDGVLW